VSKVAIQSLPSCVSDAKPLASLLGLSLQEIALHRFPDGEMRVTVGRAASTTIIYASLDQPNDKLLAILFAAEALRRGGARRLVLLAPYLCYMRQDAAFHEGEAISQKAVGRLLAATVDRVITVDAHVHRTTDIRAVFPGIEAENLSAMPAIANALRITGINPATIVVGPDSESRPWVSDLAGQLGLAHTIARKIRRGDRAVEIGFAEPASVAGRPVLLVDDIVSSGGTLIACAKALSAAGAKAIDAVITHALFPQEMAIEFADAGIRSIRSTSSVPHPTNAIPLDDIFATALRSEINGTSFPEITP
jgi:ribose-phosphate pyrophosphokinase